MTFGLGTSVGPHLVGNTNTDGTARGAYGGSRMFFNSGGFTFDYSSTTSGARSWTTYADINSDGVLSIRRGGTSNDNIRFYNTDGNYSYIRTTAASNTNNTWFDAPLGATIWLGWDNPGGARTSATYSQVYVGTGRGTINETVLLRRGDIEGKDGAGTVNYRIVATGALGSHTYFNYGNIGVGNTSPGSKLDVLVDTRSGSHASSQALYVTAGMGTGQIGTANGNIEFRHSNASQGIGFGYNTIYQTGTNVDEVLNLLSRGTSPITLNAFAYSTGNVGINTASPTLGKLQITGDNNQLAVHTTGTYSSIYFYLNSTDKAGIYVSNTETHFEGRGSSGLYFGGATSQNHIRIAPAGDVGIGTTSPAARLAVHSSTASTTAPTLFLNQNAAYGHISALDAFHSLILRGIPAGTTGYDVTAGDQMSFVEYGGDFRFYQKAAAAPVLQGRLNAGTFTVTGDVVAYGSPSDISLKTNIKPLEGALEKITKLQGVSFTWKEDTETNQMTGIKDDIGFIAQEVQEVLPYLVRKNDNGLLSLRDKGITALLVEAVKELSKENDEVKARLKSLEDRIDT